MSRWDWLSDGYPHIRDEHGTCRNCGASKQEYHYKLIKKVVSEPEEIKFRVGEGFVVE